MASIASVAAAISFSLADTSPSNVVIAVFSTCVISARSFSMPSCIVFRMPITLIRRYMITEDLWPSYKRAMPIRTLRHNYMK